jgi:hypothetical protein
MTTTATSCRQLQCAAAAHVTEHPLNSIRRLEGVFCFPLVLGVNGPASTGPESPIAFGQMKSNGCESQLQNANNPTSPAPDRFFCFTSGFVTKI